MTAKDNIRSVYETNKALDEENRYLRKELEKEREKTKNAEVTILLLVKELDDAKKKLNLYEYEQVEL